MLKLQIVLILYKLFQSIKKRKNSSTHESSIILTPKNLKDRTREENDKLVSLMKIGNKNPKQTISN